jgi:hypothetical protein
MGDSAKKIAIAEIVRARDELVLRRLHMYLVQYFANGEMLKAEKKLQQAKVAGAFFGIDLSYPKLKEGLPLGSAENISVFNFEKLKEDMDKSTKTDWLPTGFDSVESVNDFINEMYSRSNIDRDPIDEIVNEEAGATKLTVAEIAVGLLKGAGESGLKSSAIRDHIESAHKRSLHEKTVGMTLYRLAQDKVVSRLGHTWFFGPSVPASALASETKAEAKNDSEAKNNEDPNEQTSGSSN